MPTSNGEKKKKYGVSAELMGVGQPRTTGGSPHHILATQHPRARLTAKDWHSRIRRWKWTCRVEASWSTVMAAACNKSIGIGYRCMIMHVYNKHEIMKLCYVKQCY